jgi:hypothetical protein
MNAADWSEFGYSPRRRSIAYIVGEGIIKQNKDADGNPGPYRRRYDVKKAELAERFPDYGEVRCHNHGHLLCTKLLLKNLWIEWCQPEPDAWTRRDRAAEMSEQTKGDVRR